MLRVYYKTLVQKSGEPNSPVEVCSCNLPLLKQLYPPVNKHSNGKYPFSIGNTSSKGLFSIAMLVYQRVYIPGGTIPTAICIIDRKGDLRGPKKFCSSSVFWYPFGFLVLLTSPRNTSDLHPLKFEKLNFPKQQYLGGGFKHFYFYPYLGKIPMWPNIFSDGLKPPSRFVFGCCYIPWINSPIWRIFE